VPRKVQCKLTAARELVQCKLASAASLEERHNNSFEAEEALEEEPSLEQAHVLEEQRSSSPKDPVVVAVVAEEVEKEP